jgi:ABC-type molybdenum transport system ATPase subunit/photorepair protein PhrA
MSMQTSGAKPKPLRIEIGTPGNPPFKSIEHIVWEDVPPLVVLTGLNGAGKTQLLEFLAYRITGVAHPEFPQITQFHLKIDGDTFGPDAVAYIPNYWSISGNPGAAIPDLMNAKHQLHTQLTQHSNDLLGRSRQARLKKFLGLQDLRNVDAATLAQRLPDDFAFMLDETDVTAGLAHVFLGHRLRAAEQRELGTPESEIRAKIGPAPWDVVNEIFTAAGFPFRVSSPMGAKLVDRYELFLEDIETHLKLRPMNLSSGEKTILGIILWLYNARHHGRFPKLLLLDEPDAHLHPSFTRHLLDAIVDVLVGRYGVRVILTTHSPSTVALAPEESLFEMRRSSPRIVRSASRAQTVGLLTAGLVTVSPSTRHVLVEDDDDVKFFDMVRDVLSDYGPTRDPRAMNPVPTVTFLPSSLGSGRTKIAGGKSVVTQWLDKLDVPPLSEIFRGAIDRDSGNLPTERMVVLSRYSIENYYLDPLVVYAVLSDNGNAPAVPNVLVPQGQEHLIRTLSLEQLQAIVNVIETAVAPTLGSRPGTRRSVSFTNGIELQYPEWMIVDRGHDLLPVYQRIFGGPLVISPPRLEKAFRRVRLVPSDLADMMEKLQS